MENVIKFPTPQKAVCCECGQEATQSIRLMDFDSGSLQGRKLFCDQHVPRDLLPARPR